MREIGRNNMKKIGFLYVLILLLTPLLISAQDQTETPQTQKARVIVDNAPIYLESNPYSFVVDTVGRGTIVTLFQTGRKNEKWLYISYYSNKRLAQVTGFIDINLVEMVSEKPDVEPSEEIEEKPVTKRQDDLTSHSEARSTDQEKEEARKAQLQARLEEEKSTEAEKELSDIQKIIREKGEKPREIEKESGKEAEEEDPRAEEEAEIKEEQEEKELAEEEQKAHPAEDKFEEVLTKITIKVRKANIRLMPSLKSDVIHQLPFGIELKPLAKSDNWYRVNLPPDKDGFVLSGYIHDSIVNETFEKRAIALPEPEEPSESEPEIPEEEPEPAPEPPQEIQPAKRIEKTLPSFWVGGGAGYTMPSENNFEKGLNLSGTLGFGITKYLAVEVRVPYYQSNVSGSIEGLSAGQFKAVSCTLSVQARYPLKNLAIPYLVGGGDYHLNTFTLDNEIVNSWNVLGFDIEEHVDHTFGFHFGGGIDMFILRNLALNLDVRYYTASLKGNWRLTDTITQVETTGPIGNIELNSIQAGISMKFFFNR